MTGWDSYKLICMHGVRENLDDHPCPECYKIAEKQGLDLSNGKTYIFSKIPNGLEKDS